MESIVYLSLGTNLGNRLNNINTAIDLIESRIGPVFLKSNIYTTEPLGFESNDDFLNSCLSIKTSLPSDLILKELKKIEIEIGRTKKSDDGIYESRIIDIDIILFGDLILNTDGLIIPHPRYKERLFVLKPLNEIASNIKDPENGKTIKQLCIECIDQSAIKIYQD